MKSCPVSGTRRLGVALQLVEARVESPASQQLGVRAFLMDSPVMKHEDTIRALDGRETVGNGDAGAADAVGCVR